MQKIGTRRKDWSDEPTEIQDLTLVMEPGGRWTSEEPLEVFAEQAEASLRELLANARQVVRTLRGQLSHADEERAQLREQLDFVTTYNNQLALRDHAEVAAPILLDRPKRRTQPRPRSVEIAMG